MSRIIQGTFSADGDSVDFVANKFTALIGNDSAEDFGSGTVQIKYKQDDQLDWTTDPTSYNATATVTSDDFLLGVRVKLTMTGSTNPDVDYSIKYE